MNTEIPKIYQPLTNTVSSFKPLKDFIDDMWAQSRTELEFLSFLKTKTDEFFQYGISDLDLLADEVLVSRETFNDFSKALQNLKGEQMLFTPKLRYGELTSEKNGLMFKFQYDYYYWFEKHLNAPAYTFRIYDPNRGIENCFSFQLREMENGKDLKVVDLYPDSFKYYLGKGISIAIILESRRIFNKRIISSSNSHKSHHGEFNTAEAIEKVWNKLLNAGNASYSSELDYYIVE